MEMLLEMCTMIVWKVISCTKFGIVWNDEVGIPKFNVEVSVGILDWEMVMANINYEKMLK